MTHFYRVEGARMAILPFPDLLLQLNLKVVNNSLIKPSANLLL